MGDRLTSEWTPTLEEAFGLTGEQGERGELLAKRILENCGYSVTHVPSDYTLQTSGIDLIINNKFGVDVKANLHSWQRYVIVEKNKLLKSSAHFWMHVNLKNPNDYVIYKVEDMKRLIHEKPIERNGCVTILRKDIP